MKQVVLHKADTRGSANHGWLQSFHTFSFAGYYHPERIHFGALRVLNDDTVSGGMGFGTHPHDNMEIIQIWIFPNKKNVTPRYDQITMNLNDRINKLQQVLSPNPQDEGVWIHQDAWFHLGNFENEKTFEYQVKKEGNGVYAFVLKGSFLIDGELAETRDGMGISGVANINFVAKSDDAEILLMEVPMQLN